MRVLVIGASGRTGKLVVDELLQRGHDVTVLVRNPNSMLEKSDVEIITGTPTKREDVRAAFSQCHPEVVIVTLNAPRASESPFAAPIAPPRLMADSNANIVACIKEFGKGKLVIMQAFGVAESWPNMQCVLRMLMKSSNMIYQYDDHNLVSKEVKESGVNFVMVRPSRLEEGEAKPVKEWPNAGKNVPMMSSVTRGTVAKFLVDVTESSNWDGTAPVITN
jgi:putative NADH-flavin reductase